MEAELQCGVCGANRPRKSCHIIVLTEAERQKLIALKQPVRDEYVYCRPCWRVLSDRVSAPALIKGLTLAHLRNLGVSNAEGLAQRFYVRLVDALKKKPPA